LAQIAAGKRGGLTPPWTGAAEWREINGFLSGVVSQYREALTGSAERAWQMECLLRRISVCFQDLCFATCARCPSPCCLGAKIWFDFRDLIFLHLRERTIPPGQPIGSLRGVTCRYLGPRGCRLDRLSRPWICTWYICPTQTARLRFDGDSDPVFGMIRSLKRARREMTAHFYAAAGEALVRCQPSDSV